MTTESAPILLCYNGSEEADRAIDVAAELLGPRHAVVLDVAPVMTLAEGVAPSTAVVPANVYGDGHKADALQRASTGAERAQQAGLQAHARATVASETWQGILDMADEVDAAVIVLGSRGLSGLREAATGSVSHEVASHARRPVLIVPPPPEANATEAEKKRHARRSPKTLIEDREMHDAVESQLKWDSAVDASRIEVSVKDSAVTLSGYVNSYAQKSAAVEAAKRAYGVKAVADDIQVGVSGSAQRKDSEIAQQIAHELRDNTDIPHSVQVDVRKGHVTLYGKVPLESQRDEATRVVSGIDGVRGVSNLIEVKP